MGVSGTNADVNFLDQVKRAWELGEVTATQIAERSGRSVATVSRALKGEIDPPYTVAQAYFEALQVIRQERGVQAAG